MPEDLSALAQPLFILAAWSAGLALASGGVALARVVGPGFTWLSASVATLVGMAPALGDDARWMWIGLTFLVLGTVWARNRQRSGIFQVFAGLAFLIHASSIGGWLPAVSGALALGGVTSEMMLSHWYLIDPRLPRSMLKALGVVGLAGIVADTAVLAIAGLPAGGATVALWALMVTSIALMAGALAALRYPEYSGVMAATGLSYLAVLTTLGGTFLGRALVAGTGPFAN